MCQWSCSCMPCAAAFIPGTVNASSAPPSPCLQPPPTQPQWCHARSLNPPPLQGLWRAICFDPAAAGDTLAEAAAVGGEVAHTAAAAVDQAAGQCCD